jgi:hypothetical protein
LNPLREATRERSGRFVIDEEAKAPATHREAPSPSK